MLSLRFGLRRRPSRQLRATATVLAEVAAQTVDAPVETVADQLRAALARRGIEATPEQVSRWTLQIVAGETPRLDAAK